MSNYRRFGLFANLYLSLFLIIFYLNIFFFLSFILFLSFIYLLIIVSFFFLCSFLLGWLLIFYFLESYAQSCQIVYHHYFVASWFNTGRIILVFIILVKSTFVRNTFLNHCSFQINLVQQNWTSWCTYQNSLFCYQFLPPQMWITLILGLHRKIFRICVPGYSLFL